METSSVDHHGSDDEPQPAKRPAPVIPVVIPSAAHEDLADVLRFLGPRADTTNDVVWCMCKLYELLRAAGGTGLTMQQIQVVRSPPDRDTGPATTTAGPRHHRRAPPPPPPGPATTTAGPRHGGGGGGGGARKNLRWKRQNHAPKASVA